MMKYLGFTFLFYLITTSLVAQVNLYDEQQIAGQQQLLQKIELRQESRKARVQAYIEKTQALRYLTDSAGREWSLFDVNESGFPIWNISANAEVAGFLQTSALHNVSGYDLRGAGMEIGLWEAGLNWAPRATHEQLVGRVNNPLNGTVGGHATWVAGTMIASGNPGNPQAKGMAPEATVLAYPDSNLVSLFEFGMQGGLVSNHSYQTPTGWVNSGGWTWWADTSISQNESQRFGQYTSMDEELDEIAFSTPYHLIVKATGNSRGVGPTTNTDYFTWSGTSWISLNTSAFPREVNGGSDGYDCIPWGSTAKNILLVGGVTKDNTNGFFEEMSVSGWGPTDDGRIKPDLVAPGSGVLSTGSSSDSHYSGGTGTSFSTAAVSGSLALIQEMMLRKSGRPLLASSLRALAIHTATPNTTHPGPNYRTGYGVLNTQAAAGLIDSLDKNIIIERELEQGETFRLRFYNENNAPIKATLSWTDEASNNTADLLNDRTPRLINDLDLRLVYDPDGNSQVHLPWKLDPDNPGDDATRGDNFVDNVEVVLPASFDNGVWEVEISHKGNLSGGLQTFSLILSGVPYEWEASSVGDTLWTDAGNWKNSQIPPDNAWIYVAENTDRLAVLGSQKAGAISIDENAEVVVYEGLEVFSDVHNRGGLQIVDGQLKWSGRFWGSLEYQRSGKSKWVHLSSPLAHATGAELGDVSLARGNTFTWNADDAEWEGVGANDTLHSGVGHIAFYGTFGVDTAGAPIRMQGNPSNSGRFHLGFNDGSSSTATFTNGNGSEGWNFLGNPFTASFDFNAWFDPSLDIENSFHIWDSENENYVSYGSAVNGIVDPYIAPLQAFWVQKKSSAPQSSASVVRMRNHSLIDNDVLFFRGNTPNTLILVVENSTRKDSTYIVFKENANHGFDSGLDAWKLPSGRLDVSSRSDSDYMSVNAIGIIEEKDSLEIFVSSITPADTHEIRLNAQFLDANIGVWLEDRRSQRFVNLRRTPYRFSIDTTHLDQRFYLHFINRAFSLPPRTLNAASQDFKVYYFDRKLFLSSNFDQERIGVEVIGAGGQKVFQTSVQELQANEQVILHLPNLPAGVYIGLIDGGRARLKFAIPE
jgi:hypothetical protein